MDDLSIAIGQRLRQLREARGLIPHEVIKAAGLDKTALYFWEKGGFCPSAYSLILLADFYDVSVDYILGRSDKP